MSKGGKLISHVRVVYLLVLFSLSAAYSDDGEAQSKLQEKNDSISKKLAPLRSAPLDYPNLKEGISACAQEIAGYKPLSQAITMLAESKIPSGKKAQELGKVLDIIESHVDKVSQQTDAFFRRRRVSALSHLLDRSSALAAGWKWDLATEDSSNENDEENELSPPDTSDKLTAVQNLLAEAAAKSQGQAEGEGMPGQGGKEGNATPSEAQEGNSGEEAEQGGQSGDAGKGKRSSRNRELQRELVESPNEETDETGTPHDAKAPGETSRAPDTPEKKKSTSIWDSPGMQRAKALHDAWVDLEGPPPRLPDTQESVPAREMDQQKSQKTSSPRSTAKKALLSAREFTHSVRVSDSIISAFYAWTLRQFPDRKAFLDLLDEVSRMGDRLAEPLKEQRSFWGRRVKDILKKLSPLHLSADALLGILNPQYNRALHGNTLLYLRHTLAELTKVRDATLCEHTAAGNTERLFLLPAQTAEDAQTTLEAQNFLQSLPGPLSRNALERIYANNSSKEWDWNLIDQHLRSGALWEYEIQRHVQDWFERTPLQKRERLEDPVPRGRWTALNQLPPERRIVGELTGFNRLIRDGDPIDDLDRFAMGELSEWMHREAKPRPGPRDLKPKTQTFLLLDLSHSMSYFKETMAQARDRYRTRGEDPETIQLYETKPLGERYVQTDRKLETLGDAARLHPHDELVERSHKWSLRNNLARVYLDERMAEAYARNLTHEFFEIMFADEISIRGPFTDDSSHQEQFQRLNSKFGVLPSNESQIAGSLNAVVRQIHKSLEAGGTYDGANILLITDGVEKIYQSTLDGIEKLLSQVSVQVDIFALGEGNTSLEVWAKRFPTIHYKHIDIDTVEDTVSKAFKGTLYDRNKHSLKEAPKTLPMTQWSRFTTALKSLLQERESDIQSAIDEAQWNRLADRRIDSDDDYADLVFPQNAADKYLTRRHRAQIAINVVRRHADQEHLLPEQYLRQHPEIGSALWRWVERKD